MTAGEFLSALNDLEQRIERVGGNASRLLRLAIDEGRDRCESQHQAIAAVHRQFRLVDLAHRVSRAECEASHISASQTKTSSSR